MNGMCVLQEAKLAALASKRWEHRLKEQCVQTEVSGILVQVYRVLELKPKGNLPHPFRKRVLASFGSEGSALNSGSPNLLQNFSDLNILPPIYGALVLGFP